MKTLKFQDGAFTSIEASSATEISFADWCSDNHVSEADSLVISSDVDLKRFAGGFSNFQRIILEFPTFKDGRAYSQARRLRQQFNFNGDIAVRGDVSRDQLLFMLRVGINLFEVSSDLSQPFEEASREFSLFYQHAADSIEPVWRLRRGRAIAA